MTEITGIQKQLIESMGLNNKGGVSNENQLEKSEFLKLLNEQLNANHTESTANIDSLKSKQVSLESLQNSIQSNLALNASSLIGQSVWVPSKSLEFQRGDVVSLATDLSKKVDDLFVSIKDALGNTIKNIELGTHEKGLVETTWDGKNQQDIEVGSGSYLISFTESNQSGHQSFEPLILSNINSVTFNGIGEELSLEVSGFGEVLLSQVHLIG